MEKHIGIVAPDSRLRCLSCLDTCRVDQLLVEEDNMDIGYCRTCGVHLATQVMTAKSTEITFTKDAELL